ncbi:MAG: hypothetical protein K0R39_4087 [Symbiobacteriaceae bacterium]|jgi:hypothetical protein|nr:hypothetical protein [Symbiobacteriaceae bacterium]
MFVAKPRRPIKWGALTILALAAAAFAMAIWLRITLQPGPSALERLIAEQAPAENVQALAAMPGANLAVGTSLGLITGSGSKWTRVPGLATNVSAVLPMPDGAFIVAGRGTGVARFKDGALQTLLAGDATGAAHLGEGRLLALVDGSLQSSTDTGSTWTKLADFGPEPMLALAANGSALAVGGLQGSFMLSSDAGKTWDQKPSPGGSITAICFDPSKAGRLWVTAGGGAYYSQDEGATWRRGDRKVKEQPLVALAPDPAGRNSFLGVTPEGLLIQITE